MIDDLQCKHGPAKNLVRLRGGHETAALLDTPAGIVPALAAALSNYPSQTLQELEKQETFDVRPKGEHS